jgi:hypothetical protein
MMRTFVRVFVIVAALSLAAGPAFAAPFMHVRTSSMTASTNQTPAPAFPWSRLLYLLPAIGAIRIKDTGSLAKKFVQRASAAAGDYKDGVTAAGGDWETNTKASEDNYSAGVQAAIGDKRFGKGVAAAGAAKYVNRASTLGAQRYPSGVGAAEGDWSKGAQPYLDALKGMDLPPRRPKGDPGNQARANAVAVKLRAMKVGK